MTPRRRPGPAEILGAVVGRVSGTVVFAGLRLDAVERAEHDAADARPSTRVTPGARNFGGATGKETPSRVNATAAATAVDAPPPYASTIG